MGRNQTGYVTHWNPRTVSDAMKLIVVTDDDDYFLESGKQIAGDILALYGGEAAEIGDVLDIGCGIGRVARHVAPRARKLVMADISEPMLEMAGARLRDQRNLEFFHSAPNTLRGLDDDSFDLVYSVLVLQHVEREDAFLMLREIKRVLKPGGKAFLTFPNILADQYLESFVTYAETGEQATNVARARFYTPQEVARLIPASGLTLVDLREGPELIAICA
ncbi:MAG TPA: class I SAM-dependent methyltransferase [Acidimicrobiales bacterium]|nr:class I SAM-dependent methyltransferase [Acidimicrobiales bacterium]